jgi:hypothetical protein
LQHSLEKADVVASSSAPCTSNIQDRGGYKHKIFWLVSWHTISFLKKYLRQLSIDFDICNLSSSGDIVYKERWWHWHKHFTCLSS